MCNFIQRTWTQDGGAPIKCIMDVGRNAKKLLDKEMGIEELSGVQSRILGHIYFREIEGRVIHQKDIEEAFRLRKSSVTSVLQVLEKKGYIKRECENNDARLKKLTLTDEGRSIQNQAFCKLKSLESDIMSALTEEEYKMFFNYMQKIDSKITEMYNKQEV